MEKKKKDKHYTTVSDFTNTTMYQIYQAVRTKQVLARVHNIFGFCYRAQKCEKGSIQAD